MNYHWPDLWPYARTWWGWTVATLTVLLAIYKGPKLVWETYEWYMDRFFDYKIREFLESNVTRSDALNGIKKAWATTKSVEEIAQGTGLSEKRVQGCLERMNRKKTVTREKDRWKIALP
jgi:hypothetical protein